METVVASVNSELRGVNWLLVGETSLLACTAFGTSLGAGQRPCHPSYGWMCAGWQPWARPRRERSKRLGTW